MKIPSPAPIPKTQFSEVLCSVYKARMWSGPHTGENVSAGARASATRFSRLTCRLLPTLARKAQGLRSCGPYVCTCVARVCVCARVWTGPSHQ